MANATSQFGGFLTSVGIAQQANSAALGLPWSITHMLIGDAGGDPSQAPDPTPKATQTALVRQVYRAQLNALYKSPADPAVLVAELVLPPEIGGWWIRELALEDAAGNFIAVASPAPSYKPLLTQGSGRTQTIRMHVVFGNVANISLKIDPSIVLATRDYVDKAREAAELYVRNQLKAHTDAANPHPQYLRRADVAKDAGPLAWLGAAGGTADALVLSLSSNETGLAAYAAGQRFQFKASAANTGAVTAKIGGLAAVAVKKAGRDGLTDLAAGDIRAGGLYDLNYDGTFFQLGGGVGSGDSVPLGTILSFPMGTVPPGFLELDGSLQSVATYPDLAAYLGTYYNKAGDPAGYFRVPETRGEFLRGWDHGRGVDAGRAIGSDQLDALQNITGAFTNRATDQVAGDIGGLSGAFKYGPEGVVGGIKVVSSTTKPLGTVQFDASQVARTASETRGRNLAVMWCIKAWSAPVNQGSIDVAALAATLSQATEAKLGIARVATQAQVEGGESDEVIVTPKKLRWGLQFLAAGNGYLILPSWLGGFILQWGVKSMVANTPTAVSFPIPFVSAVFSVQVQTAAAATPAGSIGMGGSTLSGCTALSSINCNASWFAIGR